MERSQVQGGRLCLPQSLSTSRHHQVSCERKIGTKICGTLQDQLENQQVSLSDRATRGASRCSPRVSRVIAKQMFEATKWASTDRGTRYPRHTWVQGTPDSDTWWSSQGDKKHNHTLFAKCNGVITLKEKLPGKKSQRFGCFIPTSLKGMRDLKS